MKLKPLNNNVIVKPEIREEATKSGIVLPDSVKNDEPQKGEILAVGEGKILDSGNRVAMSVKVGDKVMFKKGYGSEELELDEGKCFLLSENDILGIIN